MSFKDVGFRIFGTSPKTSSFSREKCFWLFYFSRLYKTCEKLDQYMFFDSRANSNENHRKPEFQAREYVDEVNISADEIGGGTVFFVRLLNCVLLERFANIRFVLDP